MVLRLILKFQKYTISGGNQTRAIKIIIKGVLYCILNKIATFAFAQSLSVLSAILRLENVQVVNIKALYKMNLMKIAEDSFATQKKEHPVFRWRYCNVAYRITEGAKERIQQFAACDQDKWPW